MGMTNPVVVFGLVCRDELARMGGDAVSRIADEGGTEDSG